jgi:hypothetical protein
MTKKCNKCHIEKNIEEFSLRTDNDKHRNECKSCISILRKEYREKNKDKIRKSKQEYHKKNAVKIAIKYKKYKEMNKAKFDDYRLKNRENHLRISKIWKVKNKDKVKAYMNNYNSTRQKTDLEYKLLLGLRKNILRAIKANYKNTNTVNLLGCNIIDFKKWLGIIGNNYNSSKYHIDHIIPCALYDLTKESEQLRCFNYRNLRLIEAKENLIKGNKLDIELIKLYQIEDLLPIVA